MIRFAKRTASKLVPQRSISSILAAFTQVDQDLAALMERHDNKVMEHQDEIRRLDDEVNRLNEEHAHAFRVRSQIAAFLPPQ